MNYSKVLNMYVSQEHVSSNLTHVLFLGFTHGST